MMSIKDAILCDLERELAVTRRVLERVPVEHYKFKPHGKSMSLEQLAIHVAYLPEWAAGALTGEGMDAAAAPRPPKELAEPKQLLEAFDRNVAKLREAVGRFDPATYDQTWTLRQGDKVIVSKPRWMVFRTWSLNHMIHHRGQLCLYLRLLNVPAPTVYFNTADEPAMVFE